LFRSKLPLLFTSIEFTKMLIFGSAPSLLSEVG
jgi:hypothetical protein